MPDMADAVSKLISKVKGADYRVDPRIGPGYLTGVLAERGLMKARGFVAFPRRGDRPFLGRGARVRAAHQFTFGAGTTLGHNAYIDALSVDGVRFGTNVALGRNSRVECTGSLQTLGKGMAVGDNVGLGTDCYYGCAGGIEIGSDTLVGNFVSLHSENHVIADLDLPIREQGVSHAGITIGANCWLGAKSTILDGAHIGDGCVIAAGAVVSAGEYPPNGIYGGVPAKLIKQR